MAGATSKLSILIEAKNQASGAIKTVEGDLKGLDKAAGSISGGIGGLLGAAGIAGIGALGAAVGGAVVEMAKGAAETERLATSFDNLAASAGESGDAMLASMQQASQGTISNAELMASANRAMLLGVADSAGEMAQLLEVAGARGKAMGESTAQAFSDLVTGIGRMSPMILDNLGITIDAAKANEEYAQSIGKTAEQLTDAEKKQALLNAVVKNSTDLVKENRLAGDDAASNYERMDAALANAKDSLGQLFSPAIAAIAEDLANAVTDVTNALNSDTFEKASNATAGLWKEIQNLTQEYQTAEAATAVALIHPEMAAQAEQGLQNVTKQLQAFGEQYNKAAAVAGTPLLDLAALQRGIMAFDETGMELVKVQAAAANAKTGLGALGVEAENTGSKMRVMGADALAAMEQFNIAMQTSQSIMTSIGSAAASAGALFAGKQGGDAGLSKQKAVTDELNNQVKIWHDLHYTDKEINEVLLPGMVQSLNDADQATFKVASGTAKISDEARAAQQAFDDLTNTVSGVLSGALDVGVGVNPDDLLPRADAINEDARRLADVAVNGWASPWAEYFRKEFPDQFQEMAASNDIKTGAAIMLRNFQDGLEPELIDKEAAKARVRKILIGDENMAALATEIATELSAEMGVPMQEALAAAQGTMGGGSGGMGSEAATSFSDGAAAALDGTDGGGAFVTKFKDQMVAQYGLLKTAGTEAGKMWGAAFLAVVGENVPPELINILVTLTAPGVIEAIAQKGSLTGATP